MVMLKNGTDVTITIKDGTVFKIDLLDEQILKLFTNFINCNGYIVCTRWIKTDFGNVEQRIALHRVIVVRMMGLAYLKGFVVDHKNRDPLDNRRSNLRRATVSQNSINTGKTKRTPTPYKGVCVETRLLSKKFKVSVRKKHIGRYKTAIEAAKAYDFHAYKEYGCFAYLNFPEDYE